MARFNIFDLKNGEQSVTGVSPTNGIGIPIWDVEKGDVLIQGSTMQSGVGKSMWSAALGNTIYVGPPLRFAASGVESPGGTGFITGSSTIIRSRTKHIVYAHTSILKVAVPVFKVAPANIESGLTGTPTYQAHVEIVGNSVQPLLFSGAPSIVRPVSPSVIWSDELQASAFGLTDFFGQTVWIYHEGVGQIGDQYPLSQNQVSGVVGENCIEGGASSYMVPGALVVGAGTARAFQVRPCAVLGRHIGVAVIGYGDSIQYGQTGTGYDADAGVGGGWFARACNGASRPYGKMAIPGDKVSDFIVGNNATIRKSMAAYATHAICSHGLNDVAASGADQSVLIWANMQTMYASLLAINPQLKISQQLIAVRCSATSDTWATTLNQTVSPGFANGDTERPALDAFIVAGVGVVPGLVASFTIKGTEADGTLTDHWVVNGTANFGTSDGVHPQPAVHLSTGTAQTSMIAALA